MSDLLLGMANRQLDWSPMGRRGGLGAVGARIKKRRLEIGLTQAQLGEPKLTSAYVSLIEAGHRRPSPKALDYLARRLGVPQDELLTGRPAGLEVELELRIQEARRELDRGEVEAAQSSMREVVKQAQRNELTRVEARAEEVLGAITEIVSGAQPALEHYQRAEELWREQPLHLRFEAVAGLARCTRRLGDARLAIIMLESYRHELEASGKPDPLALMHTWTALIYPYFAAGLPEKAVEAGRRALALETRVEDSEELACMHLAVARSLAYEGHHDDALQSLRKAEEIYLAQGWRNRAAKAQINEAIVFSKKENHDAARDQLLSALELLKESPNRVDEAIALNELGRVMRHLDDVNAALGYLERSADLLEEGDVIESAFNKRELGLCLRLTEPEAAENHLRRAVDLYRISCATAELATTFKALGELFAAQGKTDLAIEALRDGLASVEERSP
jgi:tetratricopeptide (TPR) repeat protein